MLLALVIVVCSAYAAQLVPYGIPDLVHDLNARELHASGADDAELTETDAQAATEPLSTDAADDADEAAADTRTVWEKLFSGDNLLTLLHFLLLPVLGLTPVGIWLHRRGNSRTIKGFWIGGLGGLVAVGLGITYMFYAFDVSSFG